MAEDVQITRSYVDNASVKEYVSDTLVPKYFPDENISDRTVGMVGFVAEQISNISEDTFNTTSVLFREFFPNRAEIPESIYSHGAIFQLSNTFSTAGSCKMLLVLEQKTILDNMSYDKDTGIYYFYLDRDVVIYIEEIPFVMDYDIRLRIVKKKNNSDTDDYAFSAQYITSEYKNSISSITDPYVKVRIDSRGYLALEISCHQCIRDVIYETIINNTKINFPVINVPFDGKLAGFDIFYRTSSEAEFNTQMDTLLIYSQPLTTPFCYYHLSDDNILQLTFNSKDSYFMPEFNSELKIVLYITKGSEGNFESYTGNNIQISYTENKYSYNGNYLIAAKVIDGGCTGGTDQSDLETLQRETVESYRTAKALTTENDLLEFFANYDCYYDNNLIKFIKKRDDTAERIFSGFTLIRDGDYIFKTNTINMDLNLGEMENPETNVYMIEPGTLFTCEMKKKASFLIDKVKQSEYYQLYLNAVDAGEAPYVEGVNQYDLPQYLQRPCSFSMWLQRNGYNIEKTIFDMTEEEMQSLDSPIDGKFLYINPFLIRFKKSPNLVNLYLTYIDQTSTVDFTNQNEESFVQFVMYKLNVTRNFSNDKSYHFSIQLNPNITIPEDNPLIAKRIVYAYQDDVYDENNHVIREAGECYVSESNRDYFIHYDSDGNVIDFDIPIDDILTIMKTDENLTLVNDTDYVVKDKYSVCDNDLRVVVAILNNKKRVCYIELHPTSYADKALTFEGDIHTDDHITSDGRLRILDISKYRFDSPYIEDDYTYNIGDYYRVDENDYTIYHLYDSTDTIIEGKDKISTDVIGVSGLWKKGIVKKWQEVINTSGGDDILVPLYDANCEIYMLYDKVYNQDSTDDTHTLTTSTVGNNTFSGYDESLGNYIWTNVYNTISDPIMFVRPLNNIRCNLEFKDFTLGNKPTDCTTDADDSVKYVTFDQFNLRTNAKGAIRFVNGNTCETFSLNVNGTGEYPVINNTNPDEPINIDPELNYLFMFDGEKYLIMGTVGDDSLTYLYDIMDVKINSIPFIKWDIGYDENLFSKFMNSFITQYDNVNNIINTRLRNQTNIDLKPYNTYGLSDAFVVGEANEKLTTVNLEIEFDMWFVSGTDLLSAVPEVKSFIKTQIETINTNYSNNLYISNLMRKVEYQFAYVDHIRFVRFNKYSSDYQTIKEYVTDINDLTKEERREYVPELLLVDIDNITINEYTV